MKRILAVVVVAALALTVHGGSDGLHAGRNAQLPGGRLDLQSREAWRQARGGEGDGHLVFPRHARHALPSDGDDGAWYAAAIANRSAHEVTVDTAKFLKDGEWTAEIFRDAPESDTEPMKYVHEKKTVKGGEKLAFRLVKGGGFIVKFSK